MGARDGKQEGRRGREVGARWGQEVASKRGEGGES